MAKTRQRFLMALMAASWSAALNSSAFAPVRKNNPFPSPPQPAETENPAEIAEAAAKSDPNNAEKVALQQNEKVFRPDLDRLCRLAGELKQELDQTPTSEVSSLEM